MKRYGTTFSGVSLLLMCILAAAQSTTLPTELKGKWAWPERSVSQVFTLTSIKPVSDQAATATLTWWTMDTKCALRNVPIELRITDQTIAFDATTKCNVSFTAELTKSEKGWRGKAVAKPGPVVELTAE